MFSIRSLVLCVVMAASTLTAGVLTPTALYSTQHYGSYKLEQSIPKAFGDWRLDESISSVVVAPEVEAELAKYYNETVSRTYINSKGERIMLSLAYGGDQGRALQVHKPEVCYAAQGFKIVYDGRGQIQSNQGTIPVRRLVATHGPRVEPITYWIRSGDSIVTGWYEQNKARLYSGLIRGEIADGLLVRVSNISGNREQSYQLHDQFMKDLLAHTQPVDHAMLLGRDGLAQSL
ncbi:exosortase-associated protein EpsI, B-type [Aquabacterium fontiphilum]|jgi:EpsI family protein|uniref:exosortase-associated protein EpsI, B-type n=1 Tax=Aquabacterium fontiphilum TaxID=450365 RepID=UPI0022AA4D33|nr:exosortase-associated protein EpsI, B-type [Aquabacterium fontiphilum]